MMFDNICADILSTTFGVLNNDPPLISFFSTRFASSSYYRSSNLMVHSLPFTQIPSHFKVL